MQSAQPGILADLPKHARFLTFDADPGLDIAAAFSALQELVDGERIVVGLGASLIRLTGKSVPGLRPFPVHSGEGFDVPGTPHSLWVWLRGEDRGELYHRTHLVEEALAMDFVLREVLDCFLYAGGKDLSGYEDGTENPKGEAATLAALVRGQGGGLDGSSYVAVQQWEHDMHGFEHLDEADQDEIFGRHKQTNVEFDAPPSAHTQRAAQESFDPQAFMLRRSMPWVEGNEAGLNFIAFGKSLDAFEAVLNRMVGNEDGISDALFTFTRPISGAYYWCPPMQGGKLDLSALGI